MEQTIFPFIPPGRLPLSKVNFIVSLPKVALNVFRRVLRMFHFWTCNNGIRTIIGSYRSVWRKVSCVQEFRRPCVIVSPWLLHCSWTDCFRYYFVFFVFILQTLFELLVQRRAEERTFASLPLLLSVGKKSSSEPQFSEAEEKVFFFVYLVFLYDARIEREEWCAKVRLERLLSMPLHTLWLSLMRNNQLCDGTTEESVRRSEYIGLVSKKRTINKSNQAQRQRQIRFSWCLDGVKNEGAFFSLLAGWLHSHT